MEGQRRGEAGEQSRGGVKGTWIKGEARGTDKGRHWGDKIEERLGGQVVGEGSLKLEGLARDGANICC